MYTTHEGGCFCGSVRYRTSGLPDRVSMCSCEWCRKRTGSAFGVSAYFDTDGVTFSGDEPKTFHLISEAGRWIETGFCRKCGTTICWTLEFLPGKTGLAGGTFDEPGDWLRPDRYVFDGMKPVWLQIDPEIPCFRAMQPKEGEPAS